ncbi:MAG: glycosyltransferase family 2 protein [Anaerolineae bacterium]|nr:glycosyltransferase family 2 protein [Anaerolineae bacterium]
MSAPEMQASQAFVVVIPAFNEARFIGSVVIQSLRFTPQVLVIDDGSQDDTAYIAEQAGAMVIRHERNGGKSKAVNTALNWARENQVQALVLIDGDGQSSPLEIPSVVAPVLSGEADVVIGSRFLQVKSDIPVYRQVGQHLLTAATNLTSAVNVTDSQSGFRALSRRAIEAMFFTGTGLSVESEMQFLMQKHQLRLAEVPVSVVYAEPAKRNPVAHGVQILTNLIKLVSENRPLTFFGGAGLASLLIGILFGLHVTDTYFRTFQLAVGYAMISVLLTLLGVIAVFVGIILHNLRALVDELKMTIQER